MTDAATEQAAMHYAVTVAIKCKEDYGIALDIYKTADWLPHLYNSYYVGHSTAWAAFICVNNIQRSTTP